MIVERAQTLDMQALADALPKLVPLGLPVGVDQVLMRLGLERPGDEDETLRPAAGRRGGGGCRRGLPLRCA